jgi:hypoxanthine phosphoribosyltransferase
MRSRLSDPVEIFETPEQEIESAKGRVLIPETLIKQRVQELGREISSEYSGRNPIVVGILKGSFVFCADLIRAIDIPITMDFMMVKSYAASSSTGELVITHDLSMNIFGRHVILVDDIVDTGYTMERLIELLRGRNPASVVLCALLKKKGSRWSSRELKYIGFSIPDVYVVGYGLDFNGDFRNYPYIDIYTGLDP